MSKESPRRAAGASPPPCGRMTCIAGHVRNGVASLWLEAGSRFFDWHRSRLPVQATPTSYKCTMGGSMFLTFRRKCVLSFFQTPPMSNVIMSSLQAPRQPHAGKRQPEPRMFTFGFLLTSLKQNNQMGTMTLSGILSAVSVTTDTTQ